jgi:hypothetical protein
MTDRSNGSETNEASRSDSQWVASQQLLILPNTASGLLRPTFGRLPLSKIFCPDWCTAYHHTILRGAKALERIGDASFIRPFSLQPVI